MLSQLQQRQRGVALVVVMIFVLALSALAAFSARNSSVGEKVARNQLDYQVARQAAEAALRDAERDLLLVNGTMRTGALCARGFARPVMDAVWAFTPTCETGQCTFPDSLYAAANYSTGTNSEPWWPVSKGGLWNNTFSGKPSREKGAVNCDTFTGGVTLGTFTGAPAMAGVSRQPEYLVEVFQRGTNIFFRVTGRGFGYSANTEVVLQSYFKPFL